MYNRNAPDVQWLCGWLVPRFGLSTVQILDEALLKSEGKEN